MSDKEQEKSNEPKEDLSKQPQELDPETQEYVDSLKEKL
tara:strand:+ start:1164 stop:1280 length:117 start_codon:yes stop_codon:yes gene_type:complete